MKATYPDRAFAHYMCNRLRWEFHIGFNRSSPLKSASSNMVLAHLNPEVVTAYLQRELSRGRMPGPFNSAEVQQPVYINRFGVIPKGHNTGKWRLIRDLSFPHGLSVNDSIDSSLCYLCYTTVDHNDIAAEVATLGKDALIEPPSRLDFTALEPSVQLYFRNGLAPATQKPI